MGAAGCLKNVGGGGMGRGGGEAGGSMLAPGVVKDVVGCGQRCAEKQRMGRVRPCAGLARCAWSVGMVCLCTTL